ncbi:MAG TPA: aldo/keto reductase [Woeseiaceae bacterium]|nr:aldo/keto reductase [Woeseiaceae bacterium]
MISRPIPVSGEALPVIGLGTWQVFDVPGTPEALEAPRRIVDLLVEHGGSVIDSSPMYGRAEKVVGDVIAGGVDRDRLFLATKVWTDGKVAGIRQMERSADLMNTDVIDLMQVHNRRDLDVHLETIRQWQAQKRIRYSGVTDYRASALDEMAALMKKYRPNFIQINYSLGEHAADDRVFPLAQDLGVAVLVNRPFMSGRLFRAVRKRELPDWAGAFAGSWGQFFLKFIVSHPAVTCVIPATSDPRHMVDNLGAGADTLPDAATRAKMINFVGDL